jgi:hypothetical protein
VDTELGKVSASIKVSEKVNACPEVLIEYVPAPPTPPNVDDWIFVPETEY